MKRSTYIIIAIVFLILTTGRLFLKIAGENEEEKQAYVQNLNYNFSARVDSIIVANNKRGRGFLVCKLTEGEVSKDVEDNLNRKLINYEWMRFLFFGSSGKPQLFLRNISAFQPGDSINVNSDNDRFVVYRGSTLILESTITRATWQKVSYTYWLKE